MVVLNITRDSTWIETEAETLATQTSQTGATITTSFAARGNLPGPAVFEASNPIATARRYWEVEGAVTQYQAADSYHYFADQFDAGAATLDTDADAIDGNALELSGVVPTPRRSAGSRASATSALTRSSSGSRGPPRTPSTSSGCCSARRGRAVARGRNGIGPRGCF